MAKKLKVSKPDLPVVDYHVVPNGKRWDVERDATFTGAFAYEVNTAIGLATSAAQPYLHTVCSSSLSGGNVAALRFSADSAQ
jgi:hypothetical protein